MNVDSQGYFSTSAFCSLCRQSYIQADLSGRRKTKKRQLFEAISHSLITNTLIFDFPLNIFLLLVICKTTCQQNAKERGTVSCPPSIHSIVHVTGSIGSG